MKVGVIANGEWQEEWGKEELKCLELLVCADGGANLAIASGRIPDVVIGDLDSIAAENLISCQEKFVKIIKYPREKNETDLELALDYVFNQLQNNDLPPISEVFLYGATGSRIDHFLGNLALLQNWALRGKRIVIEDALHKIWITSGKEIVSGKVGGEISLIPITPKALVSLEGFYYPLQREVLLQHSPRGISNVFSANEATIIVHEGMILVIMLKEFC